MNSGSVLAKISTTQQIPYLIFNVKSLLLIIINLIFNFNTILTLNSSMINLISVIIFSFDDSFTSQNILKE